MAATLALHREEHILEWTPAIPGVSSIMKDGNVYHICIAKDCWVFPWKDTKLPINVVDMSISDNVCGIVTTSIFKEDQIMVYPKIIRGLYDTSFLSAKGKGLLPRKLKAGTSVAQIIFVKQIECQLVLT